MTHSIRCTDCGAELPEDQNADSRKPCPECGSLKRTVHLRIEERIEIHESVGLKARKPGEKKPHFETVQGDDLHRAYGRWYKKERVIDQETDHYKEIVHDPKTGQVVHHCEEPLSEHRGHGSVKRKKEYLAGNDFLANLF